MEDVAECSAWVRAIERRQHRTAWVSTLRASGWKPTLVSVMGNNFGVFTASLKATVSLKQCTLVRDATPMPTRHRSG